MLKIDVSYSTVIHPSGIFNKLTIQFSLLNIFPIKSGHNAFLWLESTINREESWIRFFLYLCFWIIFEDSECKLHYLRLWIKHNLKAIIFYNLLSQIHSFLYHFYGEWILTYAKCWLHLHDIAQLTSNSLFLLWSPKTYSYICKPLHMTCIMLY